jgi:hypothetical protein
MAGNNAIRLNGNSSVVGDARSGGNVNLQNGASITGSVYRPAGTSLMLNAGATVGADLFPVDPQLPPLPAAAGFTCPTGGADQSGGNGQSLTLTPGTYGAINYGSTFTLTLDGSGDYFFDSISSGNGTTLIVTQPNTRVFVCDAAGFGSVDVQTPSGTPCDLSFEVHAAGNNAFQAGQGSNWLGNVFTPFGEVHFGAGSCCSSFVGTFQGDQIDLEHAIQGASLLCGNQQEQFQTGKDATILHGRQNTNNGVNKTLRVDSQTRSLVAFNVAQVNFAQVTSAKLTLTISNNGFDVPPFSPSGGWPKAGGAVYAARLFDGYESWAQGNGNNYPINNNPRGNGPGVTWVCSTDTEIANDHTDCVKPFKWKAGGKKVEGPLRGPVIHTSGMADGTQVVFDVTPDVQAGLGPQDKTFMTWFIQRTGPGAVAYYSIEGATAAGHPEYAPQLQILP